MKTKTFQPFLNRCPVCGSSEGTINYAFAESAKEPGIPLHMMGHLIRFFTCKCGAVTKFEELPMITGVFYPDRE